MDNFLDNGAVLPSGLIGIDQSAFLGAFKKTYQNVALRVGIVTAYYPVSNENNINKLTAEYDVFVYEQNEDKGSTPITYKHCLASSGFGSKADFFEAKLRQFTKKTTKEALIVPTGQNGAIVLLLCLNGLTDTGIIVSALLHPDRKTTITDEEPHLEGEYNGVHILINGDGSCTFTVKGATDGDGNVINPKTPTVIQVSEDGTLNANNGVNSLTMTPDGTTTVTAKKININVTGDATITAEKAIVNASEINLNGDSGQILTTSTMPFVDLLTGLPSTGVPSVKAG